MKERFDFSNISKIILEGSKRDSFRKEYFYTLFAYAFSLDRISITDEGNISRILNGKRNVPKNIANLYQLPSNFEHLKEDVSAVLEEVFDISQTKEQIYKLLMNDIDLSVEFKKELSKNVDDDLLFITKCIAESISRNHIKQKAYEMRDISEKRLDLADYLLDCNYPILNKNYFGRDKEMEIIHERLNAEKCLFLHGIGGIGKSELALHYGKKFEKEYRNILYLRYSDSLYQTICKLNFADDSSRMSEQKLFQKHYQFFKRLNEDTLVILDHFNTLLEEDELLQDFLSLPFQLLVTTRNKIQEYPCYEVKEIESIDELKKLFYAYAPTGKSKPYIIQEIIEEVYRHTMTVEMSAKTLNAMDLDPEELLETLKADRLNLSNPNEIRIQKDARIKKATPKEHLAKLFQLQNLSDESKVVLRHIRLLPDSGIPKKLFCKWMEMHDFNQINDLICYGWIQNEEKSNRIFLHPFLNEMLGMTEQPSFLKCRKFIENVGNEYTVKVENEIFYRDLLGLAKSIFKTIEIDDTALAFCLLEHILIYLEKYMYLNTMRYMLRIFKQIIPMKPENKKEYATYKFYKGITLLEEYELKTTTKYFQDGIAILKPFNSSNAELAIKLYHGLSICHLLHGNQKQFEECARTGVKLRELYGFADSLDYEYENLILTLVTENGHLRELQEIFEIPEFKSFMKITADSEDLKITKKALLTDIEKIEPNEWKDDIRPVFEDIKSGLTAILLGKQDSSSFDDLFLDMLQTIENCFDGNGNSS